jgi:glycosyltransferase involved in cell wall biosynthesis
MKNIEDLKVALVHDFLIYPGGAEKVLEALTEMFPEAPIYTMLYDKEKMSAQGGPASGWRDKDIRTSFLQKFPRFLRKHYQWLLPFYPVAPEMLDLREFDLVISSSGAWSKGIITKLNMVHIAYIHSAMRFVWDWSSPYIKENRKEKFSFFIRPILSYLRIWDKLASERPDYLIANSKYTEAQIRKYYRRESSVIYPPVETKSEIRNPKSETNYNFEIKNSKQDIPVYQHTGIEKNNDNRGNNTSVNQFADVESNESKKYFLIISRLSPYKKIDKVIEAFNKLGLPLVIAGEGKQEKYLRSIAEKNIRILGWKSEEKINELYKNARAFIFPSVDDFGIAPVEAMAHGIPVIALRDGGALETVEEGKTGEFFDSATPEVIADGVRRFVEKEGEYDKKFIMESVERFGKERFIREMKELIEKILNPEI